VLMLSIRANKNLPPNLCSKIENKLLTLFPSYVKQNLNKLLDSKQLTLAENNSRISTEILDKLQRATAETRKIKFEYQAAESDGKTKQHKVVPYVIVWQRDRNYLIGDLVYRDYSPINYRLDRIKRLRLLDEFGEVPNEFDLNEYLGNTWRMFSGEEEFVKIKFDRRAKHVFENRLGSGLEENLEEKDGQFIFSGYIRGTEGLKTDLMALGDKAEVVGPKELRQEIVDRANRLIEKYCG